MKIIIYTAIFGDKDQPPEILEPEILKSNPNVSYHLVCVTDNPHLSSKTYEMVVVKPEFTDLTKNARKIKITGFDGVENYHAAIWHDSSVMLKASMLEQLISASSNHLISSCLHGECSVYSEARSCIKRNKDQPLRMALQMLYYGVTLKHPSRYQVYETTLLVMQAEYFKSRLSKLWWSHVKTMSRRDQLALPVTSRITNTDIGLLKGSGFNNPYSVYVGHNYYHYKSKNLFLQLESRWVQKIALWIIYRVEKFASQYNCVKNN